MHIFLEAMKDGDESVIECFKGAEALWCEILEEKHKGSRTSSNVVELAERLTSYQNRFEELCGDRYMGKVLMGWTGFIHYYSCDVGYEENNRALANNLMMAFDLSKCSSEVKGTASDAAAFYGVSENEED